MCDVKFNYLPVKFVLSKIYEATVLRLGYFRLWLRKASGRAIFFFLELSSYKFVVLRFFSCFKEMDRTNSGKFSRNNQVVSKCIYLEGGHLRSHCPAARKCPQRRRFRELHPSNCSTQFCPPWQLRLFGSRIALKKIYSNTNLSEWANQLLTFVKVTVFNAVRRQWVIRSSASTSQSFSWCLASCRPSFCWCNFLPSRYIWIFFRKDSFKSVLSKFLITFY